MHFRCPGSEHPHHLHVEAPQQFRVLLRYGSVSRVKQSRQRQRWFRQALAAREQSLHELR
jgi:hypothetical protein